MKQTIFKNIRLIAFALVLAIGASYVSAAWNNPTATPSPYPTTLVHIPINTGPIDQTRNGSLSVGVFSSVGAAQFDQNLFIADTVYGGTPSDTSSTVMFGANDEVSIKATGGVKAKEYLRSAELSGANGRTVCADTQGNLIICP